MKTILTALILSAIATATFAATQPSPELLKQKENFSKTELFEPHQVFADKAANAALLREYEANPGLQARPAYADSPLLSELRRHCQGEIRI